MSISPPSDIILDVARAADPDRILAATERLVQLAGNRGADAGAFASLIDGAGAKRGPDRPFDPATARVAMQNREVLAESGLRGALPSMKPYQEFESFVLRSFVESMLPRDAESVFGSGAAGDVWKGMLAEKIGAEIAQSGGIGIAEQLAKIHPSTAPRTEAAGGAGGGLHAGLHDDPFGSDASAGRFFTSFWRTGG